MNAILKVFTSESVFRTDPMTFSDAKMAADSINNECEGKSTAKVYVDGKVVYSRLDTLLADFNARIDGVFNAAVADLYQLDEVLYVELNDIKSKLESAKVDFKLDACTIKGDLSYKSSRYYLQPVNGA